ncbi:ABC-F family ATP-binding cassette domain-containing protein [Gorillibacterium timonense]|uniref:ABC-F family ATP-binding cassette domain-containing protein n=1 Tax=Gorillibacterium timonense TaxID=1689269 RepID=UPI00071E266C|nr:ABC-F family ATP-binding cassette domain-containing protein [Gorillibacterium timonense]
MLLQAVNINKSYGVRPVLSNITMLVNEREKIGLVGVNGAGKSTFLQIIAGEMSYDSGDMFKAKETTIGYLAQNSGLDSKSTIREEMLEVFEPLLAVERELRELEEVMADPSLPHDSKRYEDILNKYAARSDYFREKGGYGIEAKIRGILSGMGFGEFPPTTSIETLSGGQKTRLALAKMLLREPDLLLLDEPTNHLDIDTLTWLEEYLRGYPGAIVVVSHDRYFLDALVGTIYEIERHTSKRYTGNYSKYIEIKAAEYESQMKQYEKQQDEIARMEDFIQKNIVRASTTKRAQSRRKALDKMDRMDKPLGDLKRASFSFEVDVITGKDVLRADRIAVAFQNDPPLFRNVSFQLSRGETVALIGPNGIGKSTLLKVLTGARQAEAGLYEWGTNVRIGYYDQEQKNLNPNHTVLEELWSAYPHLEEARIRTVLGNFLFSGEDVFKKVAALSGGEKARVSLAKLMLQNANVLILDEPTNHLDLYSKEVLEASLIDYEGTLLFISHDRYFLNKMAERILELHPDGVENFLGNYDDYLEKKKELADIEGELASGKKGATKHTPGSFGGGSRSEADAGSASKNSSGVSGIPNVGGKSSGEGTAAARGGSSEAGSQPIRTGDYETDKQAKREERSRQRRIEQLEKEIARLEEELAVLEEELTQPEVYNDYLLVQEKNEAIDTRKAELEKVYAEWEELLT